MKTLTIIVATGALLVAGAPTAGAKNTLQCSLSTTRSTTGHAAAGSPYGFRVQRNLMYIGTWHPALTSKSCKTLQSAKSSPAGAANASQGARDSL
jgi:hypothetical protein